MSAEPETPYDTHNRLAKEFVQMAGRQTRTVGELMIVVESSILASMHLLVRMHGVSPKHASVFLEAALQAATERFAETERAG